MATIDYKEKYVQALERARQFSEKPYLEDSAGIVEYIFPELKESKESKESERIRELLLSFVKYDMSDNYSDDFSKEDCLAWLEKQKVLTTEEDLQGKEDVLWCIKQAKKHAKDENEMGTCWFAEKWLEKQGIDDLTPQEAMDIAVAKCFEQGGQKPNYCHHEVDLSNCSEEYRKAYYDWWNNCNQQHAQLEAEQKPAWNEDDDVIIDNILLFRTIDNLKFLKDTISTDPKYAVNIIDIEREITWLKSLRPQNTWKPSELDILLLERIANGKSNPQDFQASLYGLIGQLKKLSKE